MELSIQYSLSEKWLPAESLEVYRTSWNLQSFLRGTLYFLLQCLIFKIIFYIINGYSSSANLSKYSAKIKMIFS